MPLLGFVVLCCGTMMGMYVIVAIVVMTVLVNAIFFAYRFAMKDALNMYPRPRKSDDQDA